MPGPRLSTERAELAEAHTDLAEKALRNLQRRYHFPFRMWPGIEWEDALQVSREALCRAAVEWNEVVGPFPPFAYQRCWFRTLDWLRTNGPINRDGTRRPATYSFVYDTGGYTYEAGEVPTERLLREQDLEGDHADLVAGRQWVVQLLGALTETEAEVMKATLIAGRSLEEVAEDRGVTINAVYKNRSDALRKLRRLVRADS